MDEIENCLSQFIENSGKKKEFRYNNIIIEYEIIITDDSNNLLTKLLIQHNFPWIKWFKGPQKGPAANRNNGAKHALFGWLLFTDDDCIPNEEWIVEIFKQIEENRKIQAIEGSIHPSGDLSLDMAECPVNYEGGRFWSANIGIKKEFFDFLEGFDENYPYPKNEDVDLKLRIMNHTQILFIEKASVVHPVRVVSLLKSIRMIPNVCYSWSYHVVKHGKALELENISQTIFQTSQFHFIEMLRNLKNLKFKSFLLSFVYLIVSPILLKFFIKKVKNFSKL